MISTVTTPRQSEQHGCAGTSVPKSRLKRIGQRLGLLALIPRNREQYFFYSHMTTINGKKADRFSDKIVRSVVIAVAFGLVFQTGISSSTTPTNGKLAAPPDFTGVYQLVSNNANLPAGLKNTGSPEEI